MNDDNTNRPNDETAEFYLNQMRLKAAQSGPGSMDDLAYRMILKVKEQHSNPNAASCAMPDDESWDLLQQMTQKLRQQDLLDESVEQLLVKLHDPNNQVRIKAVQRLGERRDPRAIEPLIQCLYDPNNGVRFCVPLTLSKFDDPRVIQPLIETIGAMGDIGRNAEHALLEIGAAAVPALIAALQHPNSFIRWSAASLLGELRDERAVEALTQTAENDEMIDPLMGAIKDVAARALRSIHTPKFPTTFGTLDNLPPGRHYNWEGLLKELSRALLASNDLEEEPSQTAIDTEWLGLPGASEAQIQAAEERLGTRFPPSYREFLQVTNGWGQIDSFIYQVWSAEEVEWFPTRHQDWLDLYAGEDFDIPDEHYFVYGEAQDSITMRPSYLPNALDISPVGDVAILLLNPQVVTVEGEWEAWFMASWLPGATRYRSFWELMQAKYLSLLQLAKLPIADSTSE